MNLVFYFFVATIVLLFLVFVWSLRKSNRHAVPALPPAIPQDLHGSHVAHLPQIQQALAPTDYEFVSGRIPREALRRMRRERRRVALGYLSALRGEFDRLLRMARIIAALSPDVVAAQELERVRLTINFLWRYQILRLSVWAGYAPLPQMDSLSNLISGFSVRLEAAMRELGERAALVAEMMSPPDPRRIYPA